MADVVVFEPNKPAVHLSSVNTPEYEGMSGVVVGPDLSAVSGIPTKYWKKGSGNRVVEMSVSEKAAIDQVEKSLEDDRKGKFEVDVKDLAKALIAAGVVTKKALVDALKGL